MIRLLLAALALLSPAAALLAAHPEGKPAVERADEAEWTPLDLALPASDAWVAVPVTALTDVLMDARVVDPGPLAGESHHATMFLTPIEGDELTGFGAGWGEFTPVAQVNLDGTRVGCCHEAFTPLSSPGEPGWHGVENLTLAAGQTVWLTLVAANADPDAPPKGAIRVLEGEVSVGAPRSGDGVVLLDLVDEAYRRGVNLRLGELTLGRPGRAEGAWEPTTKGLLFANYWAEGGASATVSVRARGETLVDARPVEDEPGMVFAMGSGAFGVSLDDLHEPPTLPLSPSTAWLSVVALYADVDVPGDGVRVHPEG